MHLYLVFQYQTERYLQTFSRLPNRVHIALRIHVEKKSFPAIESSRDKYRSTQLRVESKHSELTIHARRFARRGWRSKPRNFKFDFSTGTTAAEWIHGCDPGRRAGWRSVSRSFKIGKRLGLHKKKRVRGEAKADCVSGRWQANSLS